MSFVSDLPATEFQCAAGAILSRLTAVWAWKHRESLKSKDLMEYLNFSSQSLVNSSSPSDCTSQLRLHQEHNAWIQEAG